MNASELLSLFSYELSISLLAVGGAITLMPDQHRFLVDERAWLTESQFNASITLAQVAPGPNVLFLALLGWNAGLGAAAAAGAGPHHWPSAVLGMITCVVGALGPSSALAVFVSRLGQRHGHTLALRAFRLGLAPVVVGTFLSTAWLLGRPQGHWREDGWLWLISILAALLSWKTRLHLLWMLGAGAILGALGWV